MQAKKGKTILSLWKIFFLFSLIFSFFKPIQSSAETNNNTLSQETRLFGNHWAGDTLNNIRLGPWGISVSYRFMSKNTTEINQLRYYNTYSFTKPNYSAGNGGTIKIDLQTDDESTNHSPSGIILASTIVRNPLTLPWNLLVTFDNRVVLEKGKLYHLVFTNIDPQPTQNYVSVDLMYIKTPKNVDDLDQPGVSNLELATLFRTNDNPNWRRYKENETMTPIFSLYNNNQIVVDGYGGMESWLREARYIQGDKQVRQVFIPAVNKLVSKVTFRIGKNGTPSPLIVRLENEKGENLEEGSIPANYIKQVTNWDESIPLKIGHGWATYTFNNPAMLQAGEKYYLVLKANPGDAYETFPLRDGGDGFGFSHTWDNAHAEYTLTGKNGWRGWDAWGNSNLLISDLQLYFTESSQNTTCSLTTNKSCLSTIKAGRSCKLKIQYTNLLSNRSSGKDKFLLQRSIDDTNWKTVASKNINSRGSKTLSTKIKNNVKYRAYFAKTGCLTNQLSFTTNYSH